MSRVVHFEIHAENLERAAGFYRAVFGWEIKKWDGPMEYMMVMTGPKDKPGINGGMVKRRGDAPADMAPVNGFVCTMEVDNIDECAEKIATAGGTVALPVDDVPQVGRLGYFKDTEGNIFGVLQPAPSMQSA